jgi:hypothetical protein
VKGSVKMKFGILTHHGDQEDQEADLTENGGFLCPYNL